MIPSVYNPTLYQGDTWNLVASVTQYIAGSYTDYDLTGYTAKSQLRRRPDASASMFDFSCTIPVSSGCLISMTGAPSATALVPAGSYVWDVQISGTSGTNSGCVYTVARGMAAVVAEVTK